MAAFTYTNDGTSIFIAAEYPATGFQVVASAAVTDLTTWTAVYEPGAGSAINIQATASNPDLLFFYGNFDTDVGVIKHTISTAANADISPASVAAQEINALASNPTPLYDGNIELICHINTAADVVYSDDTGATWTAWDAATGIAATAIEAIWRGTYYPHAYLLAGGGDVFLSPNQGSSSLDVTDTITATDIIDIQYSGT